MKNIRGDLLNLLAASAPSLPATEAAQLVDDLVRVFSTWIKTLIEHEGAL